jgi:hypothetical protein
VLGNESVLCLPNRLQIPGHPVLEKWKRDFPVIFHRGRRELGKKLRNEGVEVIYMTKPGSYDGFLVPGVRNCIHAQFLCDEFHGDAYAYLSSWMSRMMTGRADSFVPFFVPKLQSQENLRTRLAIPAAARVFGRHGGWDTFNIPFARRAVAAHARNHPQDHFVFLNTEPIPGTQGLGNVHYLPATVDPGEKARFLATCDAMLHARWHGETFGLAVAEFAVLGKPVMTYGGSRERAHLEMLGQAGEIYENEGELRELLNNQPNSRPRISQYSHWAEPANVMEMFKKRFLD